MSSEILITFLVTSSIAASLAILKYFYKYKFTNMKICGGCCEIQRDVAIEQKLDELEASKAIPDDVNAIENKKDSTASNTSTLTTLSTNDTGNTVSSTTPSFPDKINNVINLSTLI